MLYIKKRELLCTLILTGCLLFSITSTAQAFIAKEHKKKEKYNLLINKVHEESWIIGYRYDSACPAAARQNSKELEGAITTALQAWLLPLRDMPITEPIVNDFHYEQEPDIVDDDRKVIALLEFDLRVTFYCLEGRSIAFTELLLSPDIYLRRGTRVTDAFMFSLVHELGHAMGLEDTYIDIERPQGGISKGNIKGTVGTQPPSLMSGHVSPAAPLYIGKDDANGIIWFYKRTYENLDLDDCLFPNYEFEQAPDGCRPKNPLIFEIRYGMVSLAEQIIDQDKSLKINAHDPHGLTALHYAVLREQSTVVQKLLNHKDIDPNVKDVEGRTPAQLANEQGLKGIWTLIVAHPKGRLTTTWGRLKQGD